MYSRDEPSFKRITCSLLKSIHYFVFDTCIWVKSADAIPPPNAIKRQPRTVYPKKYAHGFCLAVLCCGYTLTDFPISIRLTSLALWQSSDCPSASKATLVNMDKYSMWIHYERLHNHNKAKHNKTVCIFLGIYCTFTMSSWRGNDFCVTLRGIHRSPCWTRCWPKSLFANDLSRHCNVLLSIAYLHQLMKSFISLCLVTIGLSLQILRQACLWNRPNNATA